MLEEQEHKLQSHCLSDLQQLYSRLHVLQDELQLKTSLVVEQEEVLTEQLHHVASLEDVSNKVI